MATIKLKAGEHFPKMQLKSIEGNDITLGQPTHPQHWQMVLVYRGKHCPLCTKYLSELKTLHGKFLSLGIETVAISADPLAKARAQTKDELNLPFAIGYELSISQMQSLGLYISHPRSIHETDRPFAEPGLFIINNQGLLHVIDISNNPFVRPNLETLLAGIAWIKDPSNNYPIRGTFV